MDTVIDEARGGVAELRGPTKPPPFFEAWSHDEQLEWREAEEHRDTAWDLLEKLRGMVSPEALKLIDEYGEEQLAVGLASQSMARARLTRYMPQLSDLIAWAVSHADWWDG